MFTLGYPQSLPRDAKVRLSGGKCAQIRLFFDFGTVLGSMLGGVFEDVVLFAASSVRVFFEGVQTFTYNDFGFVLGAFSVAFSVCFQEQVKSRSS